MASVNITLTISDNNLVSLIDIRDSLCARWRYQGDPNDNAAKLAFLKSYLVTYIINEYSLYKALQADTTAMGIASQASIS